MIISLIVISATAFALLALGWVIYPYKMARVGAAHPTVAAPIPASDLPAVSVVLATRERAEAIAARLHDIRSGSYPSDRLDVVVALDRNNASQRASLREQLPADVQVVVANEPGKASALNAGVRAASHDLLLFVDTAQTFAPNTIEVLVETLIQGKWGAMTGQLEATSGDALMDRYWTRELAIRQGQALHHSVICVTGCVYAMHRRYWRDMPTGLICDDLWSTYSVVTQGGRVGIARAARVSDPRRFTQDDEYARRLRTMTGMLQFIRWFPGIFDTNRNPMWLDLVLHKLTRPATPVLLIIGAASGWMAVALANRTVAMTLLVLAAAAQAMLWMLASLPVGRLRRRARTLLFAQRLLLMPFTAITRALRSDWDVWKPHRA